MAFDTININAKITADGKQFEAEIIKLKAALADLSHTLDAGKVSVNVSQLKGVADATAGVTKAKDNLTKTTSKQIQQENLLYQIYERQSGTATKKYLSSVSGLKDAYVKLNQQASQTIVTHKGVTASLDSTAGKAAMMTIKVDLAAKAFENISNKLIMTGRQAYQTGRMMATIITLPLIAAGGAAFKFGLELDKVNISLRTALIGRGGDIAQVTKSVSELNDQSKQLSEKWGKFSQIDISNVQEQVAHVASSVKDLKALTNLTVEFSSVGNIQDIKAAGDLVNLLYMNLGHSVELTTTTLHQFNAVASNTNLKLNDLVTTFPELIGISKEYNANLGGSAVLLSAFTAAGLDAKDATNSLARLYAILPGELEKINGQYKSGKKDVKDYVEQYNAVHKLDPITFFDKGGKPLQGDRAVENFAKFWKSIGVQGQSIIGAELFGKFKAQKLNPALDALGNALDGVGQNAQEVQKALQAVNDIQTTDTWSQKVATILGDPGTKLQGQIQALINSARQLGVKLIPIITNVLSKVTSLIKGFEDLSPHTKKIIESFVLFAAALGPLNAALGITKITIGEILKFGVAKPLKAIVEQKVSYAGAGPGTAGALSFIMGGGKPSAGGFVAAAEATQHAAAATEDLVRKQIIRDAIDRTAYGKYNTAEPLMTGYSKRAFGSLEEATRAEPGYANMFLPGKNSRTDIFNRLLSAKYGVTAATDRSPAAQAAIQRRLGTVLGIGPNYPESLAIHATSLTNRGGSAVDELANLVAGNKLMDTSSKIMKLSEKINETKLLNKYIEEYYHLFPSATVVPIAQFKTLLNQFLKETEQINPKLAGKSITTRLRYIRLLSVDEEKRAKQGSALMTSMGLDPRKVAKAIPSNSAINRVLSGKFLGESGLQLNKATAFPLDYSFRNIMTKDFIDKVPFNEKEMLKNASLAAYNEEYKKRMQGAILLQHMMPNKNIVPMKWEKILNGTGAADYDKIFTPDNNKLEQLVTSGTFDYGKPSGERKAKARFGKSISPSQGWLNTLSDRYLSSGFKKQALENLGLTPNALNQKNFEVSISKRGAQLIGAAGFTNTVPEAFAGEISKTMNFPKEFWQTVAYQVWGGARKQEIEKRIKTLLSGEQPELIQKVTESVHAASLEVAKTFGADSATINYLKNGKLPNYAISGSSGKYNSTSVVENQIVSAQNREILLASKKTELENQLSVAEQKYEEAKSKNLRAFDRNLKSAKKDLLAIQKDLQALDFGGSTGIQSKKLEGQKLNFIQNMVAKRNAGAIVRDAEQFALTSKLGPALKDVNEAELAKRVALDVGKRKLSTERVSAIALAHAMDIDAGKVYTGQKTKKELATFAGILPKKSKTGLLGKIAGFGKKAGPIGLGEVGTAEGAAAVAPEAVGGGMFAGLASGFAGLAAAAAPFLIAAAAIGAIAFSIYSNWDKVKKGFLELFHVVIDPFKQMLTNLGLVGGASKESAQGISDLASSFKTATLFIAKAVEDLAKMLAIILKPIVKTIAIVLEVLIRVLMGLFDALTGHWEAAWKQMQAIFKVAINGLAQLANELIKLIVRSITEPIIFVVGAVQKVLNLAADAASHIPIVGKKIASGLREASGALGSFKDDLDGINNKDVFGQIGSKATVGIGKAKSAIEGTEIIAPAIDTSALDASAQQLTQDATDIVGKIHTNLGAMATNWKQDALKAFDDATAGRKRALTEDTDNQKAAIDAQIKQIDAQIKALDELNKEQDFVSNQQDIRDKRREENASANADIQKAVYEGDHSTANIDILKHVIAVNDFNKQDKKLVLDHDRELKKEALDAQKQALEDKKSEIERLAQITSQGYDDARANQKNFLQDQLDEITKFAPKTAEEAQKMQQDIVSALSLSGVGASGITEASRTFADGWKKAFEDAKTTINDDKYWSDIRGFIMAHTKDFGPELTQSLLNALVDTEVKLVPTAELMPNGTAIPTDQMTNKGNLGVGPNLSLGQMIFPGFSIVPVTHHSGGLIGGLGEVPAILQAGEFVIRKSAVQTIGIDTLKNINRFHAGGLVGPHVPKAMQAQNGDMNLHLHFEGGFLGSNAELDKLVDTIERRVLPKINRIKGNDTTRVVSSY